MEIRRRYIFWYRQQSRFVKVKVCAKNIVAIAFICLTLILPNTGNLRAAMTPDASGTVYTDYFDHITLFSEGRIDLGAETQNRCKRDKSL